jgi:hypothetical protein
LVKHPLDQYVLSGRVAVGSKLSHSLQAAQALRLVPARCIAKQSL